MLKYMQCFKMRNSCLDLSPAVALVQLRLSLTGRSERTEQRGGAGRGFQPAGCEGAWEAGSKAPSPRRSD